MNYSRCAALSAAYLAGEYGTGGLRLIERAIETILHEAEPQDPDITVERVRRGVLGMAMNEATRLDERALRAMMARWDGPFTEAVSWAPVQGPLAVSRSTEALLRRDGWWPMLGRCVLSDEGFDWLYARVHDEHGPLTALAGVTTDRRRMEAVLSRCGTDVLDQAFPYLQHRWLRQEPELWERVLAVSECEQAAALGLLWDRYETDWGWEWMSGEWLAGLGAKVSSAIVEWLGMATRITYSGAPWHARITEDKGGALVRVLTYVRGAAYEVSVNSSRARVPYGTSNDGLGAVLNEALTQLFGEDADVARSLLNPATNLIELSDVMARL